MAGVLAVGCRSPVPFYRPGHGAADAPAASLGGPAPYVDLRHAPEARRPGPPRVDVYAQTMRGMLAPAARGAPELLYVPNTRGTVDVVDQRTARVVRRVRAAGAARIVQAWDLRRLWTTGAGLGALGRPALAGRVDALYFTPDGREALTFTARPPRADFRDPATMRPHASLRLPCAARHADFSADGTYLLATCAAGPVLRIDPARRRITGTAALPAGARPGDLRLAPDGTAFLIADAVRGGLWAVDGIGLRPTGFVPTGAGARALTLSRDARRLFVLGTETLTAVDLATRQAVTRWPLPAGGPAVPGALSADGALLWLAVPARGALYALSTGDGRTLRRVRVGGTPRSVAAYPQPGRHSLGGPGLYR